jgi:hypothetical protein
MATKKAAKKATKKVAKKKVAEKSGVRIEPIINRGDGGSSSRRATKKGK